MALIKGKQIKDATISKAKLALVTPTASNDPATKAYADAIETNLTNQMNQLIFNQDWKSSCRAASVGNVSISTAPSSIDGVTLSSGNRVLLKNQTTGSENGIWIFNGTGSAFTRATDADSSSEVTPQMCVSIEEGTVNARTSWRLTNTGTITVGTTSLTFELFATVVAPVPTAQNKNMAALATVSDFDLACNTGIAATPPQDGYVGVTINGVAAVVGDGVKTRDCYFSGDSGTTARSIANIASGDKLHWVGSVAGYQLETDDIVDFYFNV